jgi:pimeloyl-ACP methyl ester carboxylesterase
VTTAMRDLTDEAIALDDQRHLTATTAGATDAPLVLFLHGFPQTREAWSPVLQRVAAAGYRVVAPDQRGYAATFRPRGIRTYLIERLVDDALALSDVLGRPRFHVVGHDWGALVAWAIAARHPERLHTVTAVSVPHPAAFARTLARSSQALRSMYVPFFWLPVVPEWLLLTRHGAILRTMLTRSGLPADFAERYTRRLREPGALTSALNWYRALPARPLWNLPHVGTPTLFVWSDHDTAIARAPAAATARFVDGPFRFDVFEGVTHWIPETAPERLAIAVIDHLAAHRGTPAT